MKKKWIVRQSDMRDCGACCLLSIIKYYDGEVPLEDVKKETRTANNGTTAFNIMKAANNYGFTVIGEKYDDISKYKKTLPAIVHVVLENGLQHFIVVYKITPNFIYVMDPAIGFRKISKEEFIKIWTKVILVFEPYEKLPIIKEKNNFKDFIISFFKNEKSDLFKIIVVNLILTGLSIIISFYYKIINDYIKDKNILIGISMLFLLINVFKIICNYYKNKCLIKIEYNIDNNLVPFFIKHLFYLPLHVIKNKGAGELLTKVNDLRNFKVLFSELLVTVIFDITLIVCAIFFLLSINAKLFLILCIISIIYLIVGLLGSKLSETFIEDNIVLEAEFNSDLVEKVDGLESIKYLNKENYFSTNLLRKFLVFNRSVFSFNKQLNYIDLFKNVVENMGLLLINTYGVYYVFKGYMSIISLITFNQLLLYFFEPLKDIVSFMPKYKQIKTSFYKISSILNIKEEDLKEEEFFVNGDIRIENLTYSYNDYHKVLNNYSLCIKKNNFIEINGHNGIGKSTLCQILNRTLDDYSGLVEINGVNLKDYSLGTIRSNIIYISQREKIFSDSLKNNILLDEKIELSELEKILKITQVNEILEKKKLGLDTILVDGGFNLSGGERQKIVLARSIVRKPKILILDESLSEIDTFSEKKIISNLREYLSDSSIIYISHRNEKKNNKKICIYHNLLSSKELS